MKELAKALAAAAAVVLLPLAAQAQEKVVNIYNWSDDVGEGVLEDFTKETGIKVVYDVYDSLEMLETHEPVPGSRQRTEGTFDPIAQHSSIDYRGPVALPDLE